MTQGKSLSQSDGIGWQYPKSDLRGMKENIESLMDDFNVIAAFSLYAPPFNNTETRKLQVI